MKRTTRGQGGRAGRLGLWAALALWCGVGLAACEGVGADGGVDEGPAPGGSLPPSRELELRPVGREWLALAPVVEPAVFDDTRAGLACGDAIPIDRGLVGIPVSGGGSGTACFAGAWPTRYFALTVNPDEIAEVRVVVDAPTDETVWLVAQPGCDSRPADGQWQCGVGWTHTHSGLVIQNSGAGAATWIIGARRLDHGAVAATFDLEVTRQRPAENATCAAASGVSGHAFKVDPAGAGVTDDPTYRRALYYEVQIPPMTRATVRPLDLTHHYLFLQEECGGERLNELYNREEVPVSALVVVHDVHGMGDPAFGVELVFGPVAAEGFCDSPIRLEPGETVEVEPKLGGPAPEQCWCVASGRVVYVEVLVPAGAEVEVRGETGDETASVVMADQPAQCAAGCGLEPAFGFEGVATMRLQNESDEAKSYHLLVESRAGWSETSSPEDPAVRLTARRVDGP